MKKYYSFILLFVFIICFSMEGHAESIQLQSPSNGATVNIVNKKIRNWWINYKFGTTQNKKKQGFTSPNPIILKWSKIDGYIYKVFVSNSPKFSRKKTYTSKDNIKKLTLLYRNKRYYWRVVGIKGDKRIYSKIKYFRTNNIARIIKVANVPNFRDLGGYTTSDGRKVKQGMIYRSSKLDEIGKTGKNILKDQLKIKAELDLRNTGEGKGGTCSPAGLKYIHIPGSQYEQIFGEEAQRMQLINAVKVFADRGNYPIVFHCTYGRDRTGTLALILNGLLGVKEKDLFRDYELTFMTRKCGSDIPKRVERFKTFYNMIRSYRDEKMPLSYNIECYLLDHGVSEAEITSIKKIMLKK